MIETNYEAIPEQLFENYLNFLINKIYKILCLREEENEVPIKYMQSLQRELTGNQSLIVELKYDANFLSLLNKIEYLIYHKMDLSDFRKDIFDSISLINKIIERYKKGEL